MLYKYSSAKQKGFTLLELLTVIGVMAVLATFVIPTIGNWRVETQIEKDFKALVGEIRYLQAKARAINGTTTLLCTAEPPSYDITSSVSGYAQTGTATLHANYGTNLLESKASGELWPLPAKSGNNCSLSGERIIFLQNGKATSKTIEVFKPLVATGLRDANYSAYKVTVNHATGFIQIYRSIKGSDTWVEMR